MDFEERNRKIEQYILEFQAGNREVFEQLYLCTEKYIYFCVMEEGITPEAAKDIVQEIYLAIYEGLDSLRDVHAAFGWMKKIAFHKSMDYYRKNGRLKFISEEEIEENMEIPDRMRLPEEIMEKQEVQKIVSGLLEELSEEQQYILKAYYFEECKIKEIAEALQIPENTVKTKLSRARKQLQTSVERLEKQQGIRLHSVEAAPVLLLLYGLRAESVGVPLQISADMKSWIDKEIMKNSIKTSGKVTGQLANAGSKTVGALTKKWIVGAVILLIAGGAIIPVLLRNNTRNDVDVTTETESGSVENGSEDTENAADTEKEPDSEEVATEADVPTIDPEIHAKMMQCYHEFFDYFKQYNRYPGGDFEYTEGEGYYSTYVLLDVTGDGYEEFVHTRMSPKGQPNGTDIFRYDPEADECGFILWVGDASFYKGGKVQDLRMMADDDAGIPLLYVYDESAGKYVSHTVSKCDKSEWEEDEYAGEFPDSEDKDGDGVVWIMYDQDGNASYMDKDEYEVWKQEQSRQIDSLKDAEKLEFQLTPFSDGWIY